MTTPLLRALKTAWPGTRIVAAGKPHYAPLLEGLDSVDRFLPLTDDRPHAQVQRQADADLALILPNSWSSALSAWRAGIPRRIGRRRHGRRILLHKSLPPIPGPAPMTELYADFLEPLGIPRSVPHAELAVTAPPRTELPNDQKILAVAPGAAFGVSKVYPNGLLQRALQRLSEVHGFHILLLGALAERPTLERLSQQLPFQATLPAPEDCGLDESKSLLARADVLLAMDNGARHMAAALGTPQVVLYGPTHPAWSAHALEHTTILRREELDCLNCHEKRCPLQDHPCMTRITPEAVTSAVLSATIDPAK
jgi:heptosyltransferase-2